MIAVTLIGLGVVGYGFVGMFGYERLTQSGTGMGATLSEPSMLVKDTTEYRRGDIVIFDLSALTDDSTVAQGLAVTRIIGVAGDKVSCCAETGHIRVNGKEVIESYATIPPEGQMTFEATVAPDSVFLAGDKRGASADSRLFTTEPSGGSVRLSALRGRVVATGNLLSSKSLEPTTAFTDAGLLGKSEVDKELPGLRTLVLLGAAVFGVGVIGVIVFAVRSVGKRRNAAAGPSLA